MSWKPLIALAALAGLAAVPAAAQNKPNEARDIMNQMGMAPTAAELAKAVAEAEKHPLGSLKNPVRENMPKGQRAYLARLRCADGQAPAAQRRGNVGVGVFGFTVDLYDVTCPGKPPVEVHMDMYHDGPENRPVPGFTIAPAEAAPSV
jgi:hypothetical protein